MKIQTEVIVQEVKRYVAEDGTVFTKEGDCKEYEMNLTRAVLKAKLDSIECCKEAESNPPADGAEYYEYNSYFWYRPKTTEECDVLVKWYNLDTDILERNIGQWVCIEQSEDGFYALYHSIECSIVYVKRLFGLLGYDVSIMKKEESNV